MPFIVPIFEKKEIKMETITQSQQTQNILNAYFQSVGQKDAEGIASFFSEKIDWYIAESDLMPWTGRRSNRSEVVNGLRLLFDAHVDGEEQFELDHIFIDNNQAAVFGIAGRQVKATGKSFSTNFCMRFTIENGLISKFLMLEDTRKIEKAFIA
jgi:ketosteroid isomerase-like protein